MSLHILNTGTPHMDFVVLYWCKDKNYSFQYRNTSQKYHPNFISKENCHLQPYL